jgi:triacylglycerol esterase/lipase EstA (alpha/beta hydrolase family)
MSGTIYALLVGINEYRGNVSQLQGCVNDVHSMLALLKARTQGGKYQLDELVLTAPGEDKPTRKRVIEAFRTHLGKAQKGDVAFFYYSGHGSQEKAPSQFWHVEPDHLDETLVCYDSRSPGGWDLADKELAYLIAELAQNNPHIVAILDACHSGSGTRAADGTVARLAPQDERLRPLDSFLPGVVSAVQAERKSRIVTAGSGREVESGDWFALPRGRHVVLSACRPEETAREKPMADGQVHGVFTYYLLDTLQQVGPSLTYREAFQRAATLVRGVVRDQNPVLEAARSSDLKQPFLGGAIVEQKPYYNLNFVEKEGWFIDAGAIHGIAQPQGDETTYLKIFPFNAQIKVGASLERAIGDAWVLKVEGGRSQVGVQLQGGGEPDSSEPYKAVVVATPLAPVGVFLAGDDAAALGRLRQAAQASLIVRLVDNPGEALLRATANRDEDIFHLQRAGDRQPLSVTVPDKDRMTGAEQALARLEHMAQWMQVLNLNNSQTRLPLDAVRMELFELDPHSGESRLLTGTGQVRLRYDPEQVDAARLQIKLTHTHKFTKPLYCMLVDLTEDFAVATDSTLFGGGVWLQPGETVWATNEQGEKYIDAYISDDLLEQGIRRTQDVLKLIVSTDESNANHLQQDALEVEIDVTTRDATKKGLSAPGSTLDRLMQRVATRAVGKKPQNEKLSDWRTTQVLLTVETLGGGQPLPSDPDATLELADGVFLQGHPALQASIEILPFSAGKKDVGNLALPALFRQHPELASPFDLSPGKGGGDAGESVVVLRDFHNPEAVTPASPLVMRVQTRLRADEAVLAVGYDPQSQLYLPLGLGVQDGNAVRIEFDRLPGPTAESRDVKGSIKLFLQKVLAEKIGAEKFGLEAKTHRLAIAEWKDNQVQYDDSLVALQEKVTQAERILLYIHGFTGDTRGMVASAYGVGLPQDSPAGQLPHLRDHYDLILAYDYENINTPIQETAVKLKQLLAEAGLGAGHGKELDIIAHSLGTMVTRWFIERENGNKVVQKAILAGPPNAGTPWAKLEDYLIIGLAAALNGLVAMVAPPAAVATLMGGLVAGVKGLESIDTTLDSLQPDSPFYKQLNASDDPGVPYTVIAGNTFKITYPAQQTAGPKERNALKSLAHKLASPKTRNTLLSLGFFNQPNDSAISMKSMTSVPPKRKPKPVMVEVACDHSSYFSTEIGMRPITESLLGNRNP